MTPIFDARWREKALAGEPAAVALLAEAALEPLYRFCLYRVGRKSDLCEDVVQETLVRAIRELASYDPIRSGGGIFGWLTGLARNEVRRALAHSESAASLERLWLRIDEELLAVFARLDNEPFPDELLARSETREMVNATMSQLPPHYGSLLEDKYVQGRSVRELAAARGLTEKAVESLLGRAREAFRATFLALTRNVNVEPCG